jgi:uncharacterized membrane protein
MAAAVYLVYRATHTKVIDGIRAMVINADDGHTTAQISAEAAVVAAALGHDLPSDYFESKVALATVDADHDAILIIPTGVQTSIA